MIVVDLGHGWPKSTTIMKEGAEVELLPPWRWRALGSNVGFWGEHARGER